MSEESTFWGRVREEIGHWTRKHWSFEDVGAHWDETDDYDEHNEHTYSYFRRFVDGLRLSDFDEKSYMLDICARTGNGTLYFYQHGRVGSAVCADVSPDFGDLCAERLREGGFDNFKIVHFSDYELPFETGEFDAVMCFETIEHVDDPARFIQELHRVVKPGGQVIITTPNILWEPIHALAAIFKLHHSEGPHRFIPYWRLLRMTREAGFDIEKAETTVLVPGGPEFLVKAGVWIENHTRRWLMPVLGLRHILICRKPQ